MELRKHFCMDLTSAREMTVLIGRQPIYASENSVEMAVVAKSRRVRNLAERRVGKGNLSRRRLDAQPSDVFAYGAAECSPKYARQMNRVNARDFDDLIQNNRFGEIVVQKIFRFRQPAGNAFFARADSAARGFRQKF